MKRLGVALALATSIPLLMLAGALTGAALVALFAARTIMECAEGPRP